MPDRIPVDPLGLKFTGADYQTLVNALVAAFPTPEALDQMLTYRLESPLPTIAGPGPLGDAAFAVVKKFKAKGHLLRLMAAARASQPDNAVLADAVAPFSLATPAPDKATLGRLEKITKASSKPMAAALWRQRQARREICVCRVEVPTSAGLEFGTGFLVSPTRVLTNHHVVAAAIPGTTGGPKADPAKIVLRFDYKELIDKTMVDMGVEAHLADNWLVDASPTSAVDLEDPPRAGTPTLDELDYALLELAEPIGSQPLPLGADVDPGAKHRGWIELPATPWPFATTSALLILQHPNGSPLSLAMDFEAKMAENANQTRVTYQTGTEPGSSGSPCFNEFWDLVALHHAGDPLYPDLDPKSFNEGIPIHRIVERLKKTPGATDEMTIV